MSQASHLYLKAPYDWLVRLLGAGLFCFLALSTPSIVAQEKQKPETGSRTSSAATTIVLVADQPINRSIRGGEEHKYSIAVSDGRFIELAIHQQGIVLLAKLFDPQNNEVLQLDYPGGGHGPIYLCAIAATSGNYRLEILATDKWANLNNYSVILKSLRTPTALDIQRVQALDIFSNARQKFKAGKGTEAVKDYERAFEYWKQSDDYRWQSVTQYAMSEVYRSSDPAKAEEYLNETLRILSTKMDPVDWRLKASAVNDLGSIYRRTRRRERAQAALNESLELFAAHGDRRGQATSLGNLATTHADSGDYSLARQLLEKALELRRAENDKPGISNLVNSLAALSDRLGEPGVALVYLKQSQQEWEQIGELKPAERARYAVVLNNIGTIYDKLGRWDQAFEYYERALATLNSDDQNRVATLDSRGELYATLGDLEKAQVSYDEALAVSGRTARPNLDHKAGVLVHLGQLAILRNEINQALARFEAARDLSPGEERLANVYTNLGAAHALAGNLQKALESYEKALEIQIKLNDQRGQALTYQKRGEARAKLGRLPEALSDYERALTNWKSVKDQRGEAATYHDLAMLERQRGNLAAALTNTEQAIKLIESLRTAVSNTQLRTSYFANHENYYQLAVELKMQLSKQGNRAEYIASALEANEMARARVLLEALNEAGVGRTANSNSDPKLNALIKERQTLLSTISAKAQKRTVTTGTYSAQQLATFDREITELTDRYDRLEAQIRSLNPRLSSLTKPQPATLKQIQAQLDDQTVLIEYALGDTRSFVWVVTPTSIDAVELPERARVEALAKRVHDALAARGQVVKGEEWSQKTVRFNRADIEFAEATASLSKLIFDPIGSRLGSKRLLVVADGALQTLPFAAFPIATSGGKKTHPLIENHEVISLPSASVLVLQRNQISGRRPAPLAVAVIADPVFDPNDPRVALARTKSKLRNQATNNNKTTESKGSSSKDPQDQKQVAANNSGTRALSDIGWNSPAEIRRLTYSSEEARAILKLVSPKQSLAALDFKANKTTVLSNELSRYRIVHLATHGIMNLTHPELSGVLLSMVDERGQPQNGFVGLSEIYSLTLPADLVVLSACETGVGKEVKGEGLIALTRGFMYAGAERVVASLWKVDDKATSDLMAEFYRGMLVNKLKPAAALRSAQLKLANTKRWQNPHYWAGFVLMGEWR